MILQKTLYKGLNTFKAGAVLPDVDDALEPQVPLHDVHHDGGAVRAPEVELQVRRPALVVHENVPNRARDRVLSVFCCPQEPSHEGIPSLHPVKGGDPKVGAEHAEDRPVVVLKQRLDVALDDRPQRAIAGKAFRWRRKVAVGQQVHSLAVDEHLLQRGKPPRLENLAPVALPSRPRERIRRQVPGDDLAHPKPLPLLLFPLAASAISAAVCRQLEEVLRKGHGGVLVHVVVHQLDRNVDVAEPLQVPRDGLRSPLSAAGVVARAFLREERSDVLHVLGLRVLLQVGHLQREGEEVPLP
mmetsp:Transcript_8532/g.25686  ORF Transcript_8532/g.25686 Transcript_8532/m.25686 type:complete len:299 (-) Transcript_8532:284-1180(-)